MSALMRVQAAVRTRHRHLGFPNIRRRSQLARQHPYYIFVRTKSNEEYNGLLFIIYG